MGSNEHFKSFSNAASVFLVVPNSMRKTTIPLRRRLMVFIQLAVVWVMYFLFFYFALDEIAGDSAIIFALIGLGTAPLIITGIILMFNREYVIKQHGLDSEAKIVRATASDSSRSSYNVEFMLEIYPPGESAPVQVQASESILQPMLSKYKAGNTVMVRWHPAYPKRVLMKIEHSFEITETETPN